MYKLLNNKTCVERLSDGAIIPTDPDNIDYQAFLHWQELGNTPMIPLDELRDEKLAEIDSAWLTANTTSFTFGDFVVGCDTIDRMNIEGVAGNIKLLGVFPDGFPGYWKARDVGGEVAFIPMPDTAAFSAMYSAMTAQGSVNFGHAQALKAAVSEAATEADIAAITW